LLNEKIRSFNGRQAKVLGHENTFKSAVLLPLVEIEDTYHILFEKRAASLRRQPGEICFPGGEKDPTDDDAKYTAVRETCEELGLSPNNIEVIAPLDVMVSPFNSIIIPYLSIIKDMSEIKINEDEVDYILLVPLSFFMETEPEVHHIITAPQIPDDYPFHLIPHGKAYPFRRGSFPHYFYIWEGQVIWGLTALIMHHFVELLKK